MSLAQAVLPSAPFVIYSAIVFSTNPALRQWTAQNIITSPTVVEYLLGYGLILPFALIGMVRAWHANETGTHLLIAWLIAMPVLVSLPVNLQRRLAEGVWVAGAALAMMAFATWERRNPRIAGLAAALLTALALPSTALLYAGSVRAALQPVAPVFIPTAEARAFEWLDQNAPAGSIVLANFATGNALPAYAGAIPYIGHGPETLYIATKRPQVENFFSAGATVGERFWLLESSRANYVMLGPVDPLSHSAIPLPGILGIVMRYEDEGWRVLEYAPEPSS